MTMMPVGDPAWWAKNIFPGMHGMAAQNILIKTASLNPQPNNANDFYNTGVTYNNSVSVNSSGEKTNFRYVIQQR